MNNPVIQVNDLSMSYRLSTEKIDSFKQFFIKKIKRQIQYEDFIALNQVTFSVNKGEIFGIIGHNGAGKSTLLKIIAGVMKPSSGSFNRTGTLAPLIELGAGFNEDLTGKENIVMNGLLMGYSKQFIHEKMDEIIEFSELGKFIYTPMKNYSSGMRARLGFSIATLVQPDILIVDEVLAVGDNNFRIKSENKLKSMMETDTTVLFVSHSLGQIEKLCDTVMWLDKGTVQEIGPAKEVVTHYKEANNLK